MKGMILLAIGLLSLTAGAQQPPAPPTPPVPTPAAAGAASAEPRTFISAAEISENTAHSVTQVDGKLVLMSMHLPHAASIPVTPPSR